MKTADVKLGALFVLLVALLNYGFKPIIVRYQAETARERAAKLATRADVRFPLLVGGAAHAVPPRGPAI